MVNVQLAVRLLGEDKEKEGLPRKEIILDTTTDYSDSDVRNVSQGSLCSRSEIIEGAWTPTVIKRPPYVSKNQHLRCYPDDYYNRPWNSYAWEPSTRCEFTQWNESEFCSLMRRGTVLIAGDSLSWEQFSSLAQLLGTRVHQSSQLVSKETKSNHISLACNRQTRLVFRRDDILRNLTNAMTDAFPQVVVLNRGAHYQNDTKLLAGINENIRELKMWLGACEIAEIKCHLFWRTSVPGHPLCDEKGFDAPNNDIEVMESWISNISNYDNQTLKYHWYDYQRQNQLVLDALRTGLGEDTFEVLDAYYLNVRRPDEHRAHQGDCLHSCYPGKMDVYNQLLLHYLKRDRTMEDIEDLIDFQKFMTERPTNATTTPS